MSMDYGSFCSHRAPSSCDPDHFHTGNAGIVPIVGRQGEAVDQGVARDQEIEYRRHPSGSPEADVELSGELRHRRAERICIQGGQEFLDSGSLPRSDSPLPQFPGHQGGNQDGPPAALAPEELRGR